MAEKVLKVRWMRATSTPQIEACIQWARGPNGQKHKPSWEPLTDCNGALRWGKHTVALVTELEAQPCPIEKVLDAKVVGDAYHHLVKWKHFPVRCSKHN